MTSGSEINERIAGPVRWTNDFDQRPYLSAWLLPAVPGAVVAVGLFNLATFLPRGLEAWQFTLWTFCSTAGMAGACWLFLSVALLAHCGTNLVRPTPPARVTVSTRFFSDPLVTLGLLVLPMMSATAFITWLLDPFSVLPWHAPDRREAVMPLLAVGSLAFSVALLGLRPWRRRLVFTPAQLEYRRFGKPISIPWDTIVSLTTEDEGFAQKVTVRMRPPGQAPTLGRRHLPDGTAQGQLLINSMSVDPGTIVYALNRLWRDPDSRRMLETQDGAGLLFTGPSWRERLRMELGQEWPPAAER